MRLHFVPDQPAQPFAGHVYLKGFFFSTHCHLDYSHQSVAEPFYMHIPYRSECQVKWERSNGQSAGNDADQGQQQSGLTYSIVVGKKGDWKTINAKIGIRSLCNTTDCL